MRKKIAYWLIKLAKRFDPGLKEPGVDYQTSGYMTTTDEVKIYSPAKKEEVEHFLKDL